MTAHNITSFGICFKNLKYRTKIGLKRETKEILHGLSGILPAGAFTAILGPSGSGKTTLLNIVAGCINSHHGDVEFYAKKICIPQQQINPDVLPSFESEYVERLIGEEVKCENAVVTYIPQETHLSCLLTVSETFQIAAELKLPNYKQYKKVVKNKIKHLVDILGLNKVLDTRVSCISGGEKKRLAIGIELLSDFDVILLDEPTTGLDSASSQICIDYLKSLAVNGKTVICTIHQPSATVLQRFDHLYVLSDGYCIYQGPNNNLLNVLEEYDMKCPCYHNPADFIIEIASGDYDNNETGIKSKLIENFNNIPEVKTQTCCKLQTKSTSHQYAATSTTQLSILMRREYLKAIRNPTLTYLRLATSVANSLVLCAIFWKVSEDITKVWFNYNAILGFVLHLMMPSLMLTILTFPCEYAVIKRESINRWYSLKWYYASVTLIDLPICIIYCLVSNAIFYTLTAQPWEFWRFASFTGLGFLICIIAQSFGLLVGSLLNVVNGTFVGSAISFPMMLFAGFGMTFKDIPSYIRWIGHFSYLKYGVEGMAASVMGYNRTDLFCPKDVVCLYSDSQQFLDDMGVASDQIFFDFIVLIAFFVGLRVVTYICLSKRVFCKT
ncbi:LOW QUALITY PROTEIN: ATP-binding cassette sub-family G member 1-like [Atheta coriaria]|uniref:LOW QUALITY PROTEIN: ATP-binding cassette sub-family G member 1-like n=1 Tax=Dalotia coriaria TaxID=877792 RepID=UPI0031F3ECF8